MRRDTKQAFRARARATEASIDAAIAVQRKLRRAEVEAMKERAREKEAVRRRYTREDVLEATHVRGEFGKLRRVVRVNQKTVTVSTAWSWTEAIPFDRLHGVYRVEGGAA